MAESKEIFKNINFLKFVFAVLIVMFHACLFAHKPAGLAIRDVLHGVPHCNICVEFFFIISGFFLFKSINTTESTLKFAIKKFFRLAPMAWVYLFGTLISSFVIVDFKFNLTNNYLKFLMLDDIGFSKIDGGVLWYVQVLLWISIFYFYLAKILDKKFLNMVIWLIIIFSLKLYLEGWHYQAGGHGQTICTFANVGVLRGLYSMGIGYFIAELYKMDFLKKLSMKGKMLISVIEIYLFIFLGNYLLFTSKFPVKTPYSLLIVFSMLFYILLTKQGILGRLLDNNISNLLGTYAFSIYMTHMLVLRFVSHCFHYNWRPLDIYVFEIILSIFFGIICYYLLERPMNKFFNKKIKEWF